MYCDITILPKVMPDWWNLFSNLDLIVGAPDLYQNKIIQTFTGKNTSLHIKRLNKFKQIPCVATLLHEVVHATVPPPTEFVLNGHLLKDRSDPKIPIVLDTGALDFHIPKGFYKKNLNSNMPEEVKLHMASKDWVEGKVSQHLFSQRDACLMGQRFLINYKSTIDYNKSEIYFNVNEQTYKYYINK